jgi:hypothetical protein
MQSKLTPVLASLLLAFPALAAEPPLHPGVTYVIEVDGRDAAGTGDLTIRPTNERGEPEGDAAAAKIRVSGCDGEIGKFARIEKGSTAGSLRTFGAKTSGGSSNSQRTFLQATAMTGELKGTCRIGG